MDFDKIYSIDDILIANLVSISGADYPSNKHIPLIMVPSDQVLTAR